MMSGNTGAGYTLMNNMSMTGGGVGQYSNTSSSNSYGGGYSNPGSAALNIAKVRTLHDFHLCFSYSGLLFS
jgi:hypothetical protein